MLQSMRTASAAAIAFIAASSVALLAQD